MKKTDAPLRIATPFAANGQMNIIPQQSTTDTIANGLATFPTGFPSKTMTPIPSGGIPPQGEDLNGILNLITTKQQAVDAGIDYPFDINFASSLGGYPSGSKVLSSDSLGMWLNTLDANTNDPEGASSSTGWVPVNFTGSTSIAISTSNVTLSYIRAAKPVLILTGSLTGNRYLYLPGWNKEWTIINNCTGAYSVLVSTSIGTAVSVPSQTNIQIYCDGTNMYQVTACKYANDSLKANSGYNYLGSGLILQWGGFQKAPGVASFPIPFPNAAFQVFATNADEQGLYVDNAYARVINNSSFYVQTKSSAGNANTTSYAVSWWAIGY